MLISSPALIHGWVTSICLYAKVIMWWNSSSTWHLSPTNPLSAQLFLRQTKHTKLCGAPLQGVRDATLIWPQWTATFRQGLLQAWHRNEFHSLKTFGWFILIYRVILFLPFLSGWLIPRILFSADVHPTGCRVHSYKALGIQLAENTGISDLKSSLGMAYIKGPHLPLVHFINLFS